MTYLRFVTGFYLLICVYPLRCVFVLGMLAFVDVFKFDPEYETNEQRYKAIKDGK